MSDTNTHLDELIKAERAKANAKIAQLRRAAAAERREVDEKGGEVRRERESDHYERLATEARRALAAEKDERSKRAKEAAESVAPVPETPVPQGHGGVGDGEAP